MTSQVVSNTSTWQELVIRFVFVLSMLTLVALLGIGTTAWLLWHGIETHFVVASGTGYSRPGELSDAFVLGFAGDVVRDRYTWSSVDIDAAQTLFKERLHPRQLRPFEQNVALDEAKLVKEKKLASGIVVLEAEVIARDGYKRRVRLHAVRHLWLGSLVRYDDLLITLTLVPLIDHGAPQALRVWDLTDDCPVSVSGCKGR